MRKLYFKVLRKNRYSLGLLGATPIRYKIGKWTRPKEPISDHPRKGGGLWVTKTLGGARSIQRDMLKRHKTNTRIFACRIGNVIKRSDEGLHPYSLRVKTDGVMLLREVK